MNITLGDIVVPYDADDFDVGVRDCIIKPMRQTGCDVTLVDFEVDGEETSRSTEWDAADRTYYDEYTRVSHGSATLAAPDIADLAVALTMADFECEFDVDSAYDDLITAIESSQERPLKIGPDGWTDQCDQPVLDILTKIRLRSPTALRLVIEHTLSGPPCTQWFRI